MDFFQVKEFHLTLVVIVLLRTLPLNVLQILTRASERFLKFLQKLQVSKEIVDMVLKSTLEHAIKRTWQLDFVQQEALTQGPDPWTQTVSSLMGRQAQRSCVTLPAFLDWTPRTRLPLWLSGKEFACHYKWCGFELSVRKTPGEGNGNPL